MDCCCQIQKASLLQLWWNRCRIQMKCNWRGALIADQKSFYLSLCSCVMLPNSSPPAKILWQWYTNKHACTRIITFFPCHPSPHLSNIYLCMSTSTFLTWIIVSFQSSDKLGLSLELGSFAAGVMISTTDLAQHTLEQVVYFLLCIFFWTCKMHDDLLFYLLLYGVYCPLGWTYSQFLCCSFSRQHWDVNTCSFPLEPCWYFTSNCYIGDCSKNVCGCDCCQGI